MFVVTPRLLLRPPWPEDSAQVVAAANDWEVASNTGQLPFPYTLDHARAFLSAQGNDPGVINRFVTLRSTGELIGALGFGWHFGRDQEPELGYWFARRAWGRGYATEAGRAMLAQAFGVFGFARMAAGHFNDNPASGAVLRKLGFRATGVTVRWPCTARGGDVPATRYVLDADNFRH